MNQVTQHDPEELRSIAGDDEEILREVVSLVVTEVPQQLGAVAEAVARGDAKELQYAAHKLKGSLASVGARAAHGLALEIEQRAAALDTDHVAEDFAELERRVNHLVEELSGYLE